MNDFIVLVLLLVLYPRVDCVIKNGRITCSHVSQNITGIQADDLKICQSNLTCCSKQIENELYMKSSRVLEDAVHQQTNATHNFLTTQASRFDSYFTNLLKTAKVKWHEMLHSTYKAVYLQNRHIFDEFYSTFDRYYEKGDIDLDQSSHEFFQKMQSAMFPLFDSKFANQPDFLNCSAKHIDDIKPFGNYKQQITNQLKSSLVHARTFVVGLQTGSNITMSIKNYLSRNECREGFTKIQHCSVCDGIPDAMVCNETCHNLLHSCLAIHPLFNDMWNDYIRGIYVLSLGLDGQYNIENVFRNLAYDISSAIMLFQENFADILSKTRAHCRMESRKKRAIENNENDLYIEERIRRDADSVNLSTVTQQLPSLLTYATAFRNNLNLVKDVWNLLPLRICASQSFVTYGRNDSCWNGEEIQTNSEKVPSVKLVDGAEHSQVSIVQQLSNLRTLVGSVLQIPGNVDEENPERSGDYSGSGSGSGSGEERGSGTPSVNWTPEPTTNKIPTVLSSTDLSPSDDTDEVESSGTSPYYKYSTTSKSDLTEAFTDDEDLGSGSGNETMTDPSPTTDSEIMSFSTKNTYTRIIFRTRRPRDAAATNTVSYVLLLLVMFSGVLYM